MISNYVYSSACFDQISLHFSEQDINFFAVSLKNSVKLFSTYSVRDSSKNSWHLVKQHTDVSNYADDIYMAFDDF